MRQFLLLFSYYVSTLVVVASLLLSQQGVVSASKIIVDVVYVENGKSTALQGAEVQCFDEDYGGKDQRMTGVVKTDNKGRASLRYKKKKDSNIRKRTRGWDKYPGNSNPDIYCKVKKAPVNGVHYFPIVTRTKNNFNQKKTAAFHDIKVYPDRKAMWKGGKNDSINGCGSSKFGKASVKFANWLTGFKDACNNHDVCYYSACEETQKTCDTEFRDLMYSICYDKQSSTTGLKLCKTAADALYTAVNKGGSSFYDPKC